MKILLLGKDGQIGWELQRSLASLGQGVVSKVQAFLPLITDVYSASAKWPTNLCMFRKLTRNDHHEA